MIGILGIRGVSVIESSGDTGAGVPCKSNDGKNTTQFTPQFPASCPYVTSVGGTQFGTIDNTQVEVAWVASSGGFSNYFGRPVYQQAAVRSYFDNYVSAETKAYYSGYYNPQGRGFPDVAAHSFYPGLFEIFVDGVLTPSGGTSASAPVFAAVVALLNDASIRAGKAHLGFLNPFLYSLGVGGLNSLGVGGFNDIYEGQSRGCNGINPQTGNAVIGGGIIPGAYCTYGEFRVLSDEARKLTVCVGNATKGWDPVTGLGTPNFQKLKDIVLRL